MDGSVDLDTDTSSEVSRAPDDPSPASHEVRPEGAHARRDRRETLRAVDETSHERFRGARAGELVQLRRGVDP
jgi:hypothetical protein